MGMPNGKFLDVPNDGAGNATVGAGKEYHCTDLFQGYSFYQDTATFVARLEVSVAGHEWETLVASLPADKQGEIPAFWNFVRVYVTNAGTLESSHIAYYGKS